MRRNTSRYKYSNTRLKLKLIYNINNYDILKEYETAILVVPISLTLSPYSRLHELRKACGLLNIYCLITICACVIIRKKNIEVSAIADTAGPEKHLPRPNACALNKWSNKLIKNIDETELDEHQ